MAHRSTGGKDGGRALSDPVGDTDKPLRMYFYLDLAVVAEGNVRLKPLVAVVRQEVAQGGVERRWVSVHPVPILLADV